MLHARPLQPSSESQNTPINIRLVFDTALCLILAGGLWSAAFLPAAATAKEPKKAKKAEVANDPDVKGPNVVKVTYKGPAHVQTLTQTGPKRWKSAGLMYDEVERDEFSVYLIRAKTENERVQIDLHTRMVTFAGKSPEEFYPIFSASGGQK